VQKALEQIQAALGVGNDPSAGQTALRTILIYGLTLVIVRLGSKRFLSKATAFDVIVAIMLGSIMSRGVDGSSPLFPTVLAGAVLLGMHWLFGVLAFHTGWFGAIVKGERLLLIKDGKLQKDEMQKGSITEHDIMQAVRMQTQLPDLTKVKRAYLERNGEISIVPYRDEPQIIEVSVEEGVKTVRIELQ
jgi:uncharacterized membrane protein YcaP (DUF421 family)